jgi:hypothetical protein
MARPVGIEPPTVCLECRCTIQLCDVRNSVDPEEVQAPMAKTFKRGDHVEWNSEAGIVRGVVIKKVVSDVRIKGYVHHASKKEPQYFIKSDKTDHVAVHKGKALKLVKGQTSRRPWKTG